MKTIRQHTLALMLGALCGNSLAADAALPAELFARHMEYTNALISPTGEYVSVVTPFEDRSGLSIIRLSGNYERSLIKFDAEETIASARWTDDTRLVVEKARDFGFLEQPMGTGDIYASDADGTHQVQLFGYVEDYGMKRSRVKDEGWASYMKSIADSNGEALFYFTPWPRINRNSDNKISVYRVDTHTGSRKLLESIPEGGTVVADQAGTPRFTWTSYVDGEPLLRYRPNVGDRGWLPVPATLAGRTMELWFFEKDNNHAYARISDKGEPAALYRVDMAAGTRVRLAGHPDMELSDIFRAGYDGLPFAVMYDAGKPKLEYIDPKSEWAQLHAGLMKLFPGQLVRFVNFTKDDKKVLFYVYSDRDPGAYYLFDRTTNKPSLLFRTAEWIDPARMASTRPVEFKNAAGQTLFGFYTAPRDATGPLPMVVMPHGGPFGPYDSWGFDADAQFLASRGYAVLQVNFRGSGGRGEQFERSTYRQWGTGIQDDIADGVRWAIGQNLADKSRVCIFGASFGGYSALMNPIRNPGMYKCAIGYAGVYDLAEMYKSGDINDNKQGRSYLDRAVGLDPAMLASQSPARLLGQLDVPVLFIHGKNDNRAPIEQYNLMVRAMTAANKPFESLIKPNEGHGFYDAKNQTEAYERIEAFLRKYNPPN